MGALSISHVPSFKETEVLRDINIDIDDGEFLILVGRRVAVNRP